MSTTTTRFGLIKPDDLEEVDIDILNANSDLIDLSLGVLLVNNGVTPGTVDLRDGQIVRERTSGISWVARKNGGGTFDKSYLTRPFCLPAYTPVANITATGYNEWGWSTYADSGAGSTQANIVGNRLVAPVDGLYIMKAKVKFTSGNSGTPGVRGLALGIDSGGANTDQTEQVGMTNPLIALTLHTTWVRKMNAGQAMSGHVYTDLQPVGVFAYASLTLIAPMGD